MLALDTPGVRRACLAQVRDERVVPASIGAAPCVLIAHKRRGRVRQRVIQRRDRRVVELVLEGARGELRDRGERGGEDTLAVVDRVGRGQHVQHALDGLRVGDGRSTRRGGLDLGDERVETRVAVILTSLAGCKCLVVVVAIGRVGQRTRREMGQVCALLYIQASR